MASFWKRLMAWRSREAEGRLEAEEWETPAERRAVAGGPEGIAADERVEEQLGGTDPNRLVDDEFKP